jgi:hypothetical protein
MGGQHEMGILAVLQGVPLEGPRTHNRVPTPTFAGQVAAMTATSTSSPVLTTNNTPASVLSGRRWWSFISPMTM